MSTHLVTGAAGFIGFHFARRLLERGVTVVVFDNVNDYCSIELKRDQIAILNKFEASHFVDADLVDDVAIGRVFREHKFDHAIHLAA